MPLGVALRGRAEGAVVIIKGLVLGMELSAGNAVGIDAWQLPATILAMLGSLHRRVLSVQLISLPNCVCPMKRWPINK